MLSGKTLQVVSFGMVGCMLATAWTEFNHAILCTLLLRRYALRAGRQDCLLMPVQSSTRVPCFEDEHSHRVRGMDRQARMTRS